MAIFIPSTSAIIRYHGLNTEHLPYDSIMAWTPPQTSYFLSYKYLIKKKLDWKHRRPKSLGIYIAQHLLLS